MCLTFAAIILLLPACSPEEPTVYASFTPASPLYELVEIQINRSGRAGETAAGEISTEFTSNDGQVFSFTMTAEDGQLYLAQDLPGLGFEEGSLVDRELLRAILVDAGVVSAGQYKVSDAGRTIDLILQLTDPGQTTALRPEGFELVETNLSILD